MTSFRPRRRPLEFLAEVSSRVGFWWLAIPLVAGALYANTLHNPFIYDDHRLVVANRSIVPPLHWHGLLFQDASRPVVNISYAVDRRLWGPSPFGFHLTNVLLHVGNVAILFVLARRLARAGEPSGTSRPGVVAALTAILFAVHPLLTEAVGYVSGRSEVLCGTFSLGALLAVIAASTPRARSEAGGSVRSRSASPVSGALPRQSGKVEKVDPLSPYRTFSPFRPFNCLFPRWLLFAVALVSWSLAMGSKEIAVMLPLVALCIDRTLLGGTPDERQDRLLQVFVPWFALTFALAAARLALFLRWEHGGQAMPDWPLVLVELDVLRRYLAMLLVPTQQSIFHAVAPIGHLFEGRALGALAIVTALLVTAWTCRRRFALVSAGLVWFLAFLVPAAALVVLDRGEPMAEHRTYLASAGVFLVLGTLGDRLTRAVPWRRPAGLLLRFALAAHLTLLAGRTYLRNEAWGDPVLLWTEASMLAADHWLPYIPLGEALHAAGRHGDAVSAFATSLELRPEEPGTYRKLGVCLVETGQLDAARAVFASLQRRQPDSWEAPMGLAMVAAAQGHTALARTYSREARRHSGANAEALHALGTLEAGLARMEAPQ